VVFGLASSADDPSANVNVSESAAPNPQFSQQFQPDFPAQLPRQNISLPIFRNICFTPRILIPLEGRLAIVTDVGNRMRWTWWCAARLGAPTKTSSRTAKARGPDPPTLGSSLAKTFARRRWLQSPVHRGERAISVKTIAQGMPVAPAGPVVSAACIFLLQAGHGCGLHPAFPAPSVL
jgi:hypothetical protein